MQINASPEIIWKILMDFDHYPDWNPFIKSITGKKEVGSRLTVLLQPPGEKGMTFTPKVKVFAVNQEFRWLGKLWGGGFFNGEHYFLIQDLGNNTVQFTHGENFTGILVGLMSKMLGNTKKGFQAMNEALKLRAESVGH